MAYTVMGLAYLLSGISLLPWVVFTVCGSFGAVDLRLGEWEKLLFNLGLSVAFFLQHSGMVRASFRQTIFKGINPAYHPALYAIFSGTVLLAVVLLWQRSSYPVFLASGAYRWFFYLLSVGALAGFIWGGIALGKPDMLGIRPIVYRLHRKKLKTMPFTVRGPYRLTRHPWYFCCILLIWSCPDITADRLLYNVLWTAWIVVGARLEERDLVRTFGDEYRSYQHQVPMMVPTGKILRRPGEAG